MKTIPTSEECYTPFKKIAASVLRGKIPFAEYPSQAIKDLAHRVVVEFFNSGSYEYTYNGDLGNLEGYFVSYANLRVRSLRREHNKAMLLLDLKPELVEGEPSISPECSDLLNYCESVFALLGDRFFKTTKGMIPYKLVMQLMILQVLQENEVTYSHIKRKLGVNKHRAKQMCEKVWEFTNGKRREGLL